VTDWLQATCDFICLSVSLSVWLSVCLSVCLSICLCLCGSVQREPALQRKHRPSTSSSKSEIFFPANSVTSAAEPSPAPVQPRPSMTASSASASSVSVGADGRGGSVGGPGSRDIYSEYMLLGDQSKFASNVVYHVRRRTSDLVCITCRHM